MIETKWYAIVTKPRWEKKIVELLTKISIESYCPMTKVQRQWSDRIKTITEPLFKSYVFVNVSQKQEWEVKNIYGVINYVCYMGRPAVIRTEEIESIRGFLVEHEYVLVKSLMLSSGDTVRINSGAFKDLEAEITSVQGQKVLLDIPSLGLALVATDVKNTLLIKTKNHSI
jgi:transcription antitermination factor NusG